MERIPFVFWDIFEFIQRNKSPSTCVPPNMPPDKRPYLVTFVLSRSSNWGDCSRSTSIQLAFIFNTAFLILEIKKSYFAY